MRTTLTLYADVAARIKRFQQRRNMSFKNIVNAALREGLCALEEKPKSKLKIWTKPLPLGDSLVGSLDNVADVLAIAEGDNFK